MTLNYIDFYTRHGVEDLKRAGSQYVGWCPFHSDKGSTKKGFSVNPDNGLWKCFTCDVGGNAITYCQKQGIDVKEAPDYDPNYNRYSYGRVSKMKPTPKAKEQGKHEYWAGTEGKGLPKDMKPYNYQAIDQARELQRSLWICEGEKDTETLHNTGELAIGMPNATGYRVLDGVSLDDIPEVIIAMDNDEAGRNATETIKDMFPFAGVVIWPSVYPKGWDITDLKNELDEYDIDTGFIDQLRKFVKRDTWEDESEMVDLFLASVRKGTKFIKTGFPQFDEHFKGLIPGGLHVVQGSSSIGKTTFCKQLADQVHVENPDLPIFFFALEDSLHTVRSMTFSRLSFEAETPIETILIIEGNDALTKEQYKVLDSLAPKVKGFYGKDYLLVAGEPNITVKTIRERVERKLTRIGKSTAMVIVDYLQILPTPKEERLGSLMDRVDYNLHELQCFARDINGPVIATSSTTKEDIKTTEKTQAPGLVKGKGSANILYTPRMLLELITTEDAGEYSTVELHVLKHSIGPKNIKTSFQYQYKYSYFWQSV